MIRVLMLGDIVGRSGRTAVIIRLAAIRTHYAVDFVVANGENASGGMGLKKNAFSSLLDAGVDVVTSGNHIWRYKEIYPLLNDETVPLLRPANYPSHAPGHGVFVHKTATNIPIAVINIQGRIFMDPIDDPFAVAEQEIKQLKARGITTIVVDFHAEATAEKEALGWFLDGNVSLVIGTHTHVQTSDEKILPEGTGYITDLGRCGDFFSVLGFRPKESIDGLKSGIKNAYRVSSRKVALEGVIADIDDSTGKTQYIERVRIFDE